MTMKKRYMKWRRDRARDRVIKYGREMNFLEGEIAYRATIGELLAAEFLSARLRSAEHERAKALNYLKETA